MPSFGLVGIGGYGRSYLSSIGRCASEGYCAFAAVVVRPQDAQPEEEARLAAAGVRVYRSLEEMLAGDADIVALPVGIPYHAELTKTALAAGRHVLCEKPVAGSYADALSMARAKRQAGKLLGIGYQHIHSPVLRALKAEYLAGKFGRLLEARSAALWPRRSEYYRRNEWAGRIRVDGRAVHDSPLQNAVSHYLNSMLFIAGSALDESAWPAEVYGEQYRAKDIESADTQFVRIFTESGAVISFGASHAAGAEWGPVTRFRFERAEVELDFGEGGVTVRSSGEAPSVVEPAAARADLRFLVVKDMACAAAEGREPLCTVENSIQHTLTITTLFESAAPEIVVVKGPHVEGPPGAGLDRGIRGIDALVRRTYDAGESFHEAGAAWAAPGRTAAVRR